MNLIQLRFASAVAATGSFTAAATRCFVTQPTLSNGIAQLETELGERLFTRTTRAVALTAFGQHVLPHINEVLSAQASLVLQTQAFLKPGKRLIRIGTSPLVSANLLGLMLEPYRLRNPEVELVLREMNMTDLNRMLDDKLLDFVFGVASARKATWAGTVLYDEPLIFIPPGAAWPIAPSQKAVQLKDIANQTYVMVPDACGLSRTTRGLFRSQRRKLHEYSGQAMSYQVLQEWAALGIGAAILPKSKLSASSQAAFPIADKLGRHVTISFEAVWAKNAAQAAHLIEFANHLCKVVPGIVGGLAQSLKG